MGRPRQTPEYAAAKLREFITSTRLTDAVVAERIGVTGAALSSYLGKQKQIPAPLVRLAIERFTGKLVPASWWVSEEERAWLDRVVPFKATGTGG
jgi:hypothetical protein